MNEFPSPDELRSVELATFDFVRELGYESYFYSPTHYELCYRGCFVIKTGEGAEWCHNDIDRYIRIYPDTEPLAVATCLGYGLWEKMHLPYKNPFYDKLTFGQIIKSFVAKRMGKPFECLQYLPNLSKVLGQLNDSITKFKEILDGVDKHGLKNYTNEII